MPCSLVSKLLECKARDLSGFSAIPCDQLSCGRWMPRGKLGSACTEEVPKKEIPKHQRKDCFHDNFWLIQREKMSGISREYL